MNVLERFPKNKRARAGIRSLADLGNTGKSSNQDPPADEVQRLIDFYNKGKIHKVIAGVSALLKKHPNSVILYNIKGAASQDMGKLDEAIIAFSAALSIKSNYAEAHNNLGNVFKEKGMVDEAIKAFNKALSIKPDYAEALNNKGIALQDQGKLDEAIKIYEDALSIKSDYAEVYYNMGISLKYRGDFEEALKVFGTALSIKPNFFQCHNNMGTILKDQNDLCGAIKAYKKAISIRPDYIDAHFNLANALKFQGVNDAVAAYARVISINPNHAEAYNNMGVALKGQEKQTEAIDAFKKALAINPDYGTARHLLSSLTGEKTKNAPKDYITNLFDGYAAKFESSLINTLEYKTPKLISNLIIKEETNNNLGSVLDLGCGTGLLGAEIKSYCSNLEGIDLSPKMLEEAKNKEIYNKLAESDIVEYLSTSILNFDYFISTDVFVYIGDLSEVFRLIRLRNKKSAKFVFSTEHTEEDDYFLQQTGRFAHSKKYIEKLCQIYNYEICHFSVGELRKEDGSFLDGGLYLLTF